MKKILFISLVFLFCCEKQQREIIIENWENGNPKRVKYVIGEGFDESIIGINTYYENAMIESKTTFEQGMKNDLYIENYENGILKLSGEYQNGSKVGKWTNFYIEDGIKSYEIIYEGENNISDYIFYNKDGTIKDAIQKEELEELNGVRYIRGEDEPFSGKVKGMNFWNRLTANGMYINGLMHGKWEFYGNNGNYLAQSGSYVKGIRDGRWTHWYESGEIYQEYFIRDGKGKITVYFENGIKNNEYNVIYVNGDKRVYHGLQKHWDKNGRLAGITTYENGEMVYTKFYTPNDKDNCISSESEQKNGKNHGKSILYRDCGYKFSESYYKDGLEHGKSIQYLYGVYPEKKSNETHYKDGIKHGTYIGYQPAKRIPDDLLFSSFRMIKYEQGEYINGLKDGKWIYWDNMGRKNKVILYDMGDLIKTNYKEGPSILDY